MFAIKRDPFLPSSSDYYHITFQPCQIGWNEFTLGHIRLLSVHHLANSQLLNSPRHALFVLQAPTEDQGIKGKRKRCQISIWRGIQQTEKAFNWHRDNAELALRETCSELRYTTTWIKRDSSWDTNNQNCQSEYEGNIWVCSLN